MSTRKILTLASMVALSFAPAAFCADFRVVGEKLDSGLSSLPAGYAATEYQRPATGASDEPDYMATEFVWIPMKSKATATEYQRPATGASDVPDYMATEFVWIPMRSKAAGAIPDMATQFLRIGKQFQSIEYTGAEFQRGDAPIQVVGEKLDNGLGNLPADYTAAEFQKQIVAER